MENNNGNNGFQYTYSAKEQEEMKQIREKYVIRTDSEEGKMERIRRLDKRVTQRAQIVSLVFGVIGALIMGIGMSLVMTDFSKVLGDYKNISMIIGIIIGLVGVIIASLAYPMYNLVLKKEKAKVAPEILRLTDELMNKQI